MPETRAGLACREMPIAGVDIRAQRAAHERAAAGCKHGRKGVDLPARAIPRHPVRADHASVLLKKTKHGTVIEDLHAGAPHLQTHEAHVIGTAQGRVVDITRFGLWKRISKLGKKMQLLDGAFEQSGGPSGFAEPTARRKPAANSASCTAGLGMYQTLLFDAAAAPEVPQ